MFFVKDELAAKPTIKADDPVNSLPALLAAAGHFEDDNARVVYAYLKTQSDLRASARSLAHYSAGFECDPDIMNNCTAAINAHRANARVEVDILLISWQPNQTYPQ